MAYSFKRPVGDFIRTEGTFNLMVKSIKVEPANGNPLVVKATFMDAVGDIITNNYDLTKDGARFAFAALLGACYPEVTDGEFDWSPETMEGKFIEADVKNAPGTEYYNLKRIHGAGEPFADPSAPVGNSLI